METDTPTLWAKVCELWPEAVGNSVAFGLEYSKKPWRKTS